MKHRLSILDFDDCRIPIGWLGWSPFLDRHAWPAGARAIPARGSSMSDSTPQGDSPALVEVLKLLGREWRDLVEGARRDVIRLEEPDEQQHIALVRSHETHPIHTLFRLVEEYTGIDRETIRNAAWRINSTIGLRPLEQPRMLPTDRADAGDDDLPGEEEKRKADLPDLRWLYAKFTECDVNGTTARILAAFTERHPRVLSQALRSFSQRSSASKEKNENKKTRGKNIDAKMLKVMAENAESHGWSARQWAEHLKCSDGTVKGTKTWKERLKAARATAAADAASKMDQSHTSRSGRRKTKD